MRGDRFDTEAQSDLRPPVRTLAMESTLILFLKLLFAGGPHIEGLDRPRLGRENSPDLALGVPVTIGCTGEAEEGNSRNHPRSACPSLGLSTHAARATGSRRRKASSRWTVRLIAGSPSPSRGKNGLEVSHPEHVARGPSAPFTSSAPNPHAGPNVIGSPRRTKHEEGCGLRRDARIEARECARTSQLFELQKSIGDHCRPHRSSFTGHRDRVTREGDGE